jgi:hypothetical protein
MRFVIESVTEGPMLEYSVRAFCGGETLNAHQIAKKSTPTFLGMTVVEMRFLNLPTLGSISSAMLKQV